MNSADRITSLRNRVDSLKGAREEIQRRLDTLEDRLGKLRDDEESIEGASVIIRHVAGETQKALEYHISEIVSLALKSVFPEPYEMKLIFEQKRNNSEARIVFTRDGMEIDPMTEAGGGVVDVASFALRIAMWKLSGGTSRNTFILDEPFKFVSRDLQNRASALLKELSQRLNLQFIIVTHNDALEECADRIFRIEKVKGVSIVNEQRT